MKQSNVVALALLSLCFTNCKTTSPEKRSNPLQVKASTAQLAIPVKLSMTDKTVEILETSENALVTESAYESDKEAIARGCRYKVTQGKYSFTTFGAPVVDTAGNTLTVIESIPDLDVAGLGVAGSPHFVKGVATIILSKTADEQFQLDMIVKNSQILLTCSYLGK